FAGFKKLSFLQRFYLLFNDAERQASTGFEHRRCKPGRQAQGIEHKLQHPVARVHRGGFCTERYIVSKALQIVTRLALFARSDDTLQSRQSDLAMGARAD